jgi:hypothetical protein
VERAKTYAVAINKIKAAAPDLADKILRHEVVSTDKEIIGTLGQLSPANIKKVEDAVKSGGITKLSVVVTNDRQLTINDDGDVVAVKEMKKYYLEKKRPGLEFGAICELSLLEGSVKYNSTAGDFVYETACFRKGSEKSFELALDGLLNTCSGCMNLKDGCKKLADHKAVAEMAAKQLAPLGLLDAGKAWKKEIYGGGYALVGWVKRDDGKPEFMVCVDSLNVARVPDNDIANIGKIERKHLISGPVYFDDEK